MKVTALLTFALAAAMSGPVLADFETCKAELAADARASGIPATTVETVFADVAELPRVIASDRAQPEFTQTFTEYYDRRVTQRRVDRGRQLLIEHAPLLADISNATGIPAHYLVALWGLETNFGGYFGKLYIPSALTTLACDARRAEFFKRELFAVLEIVAAGDIEAHQLTGSWAGAIGHMQFMPSTFKRHAVDGDGDGRRDLVGSIPDALTSGARYLNALGWEAGFRWGREVGLAPGFDYATANLNNWQPLAHWRDQGVTDAFGKPLAAVDVEAAILVPTGHKGPAFMVYPNFRVIMGWNRSQSYALTVGRLADRIAGAGRLHTPLPPIEDLRIATQDLIAMQEMLSQLGFDAGPADGLLGPATQRAIAAYQASVGLVPDGFPSQETRSRLLTNSSSTAN